MTSVKAFEVETEPTATTLGRGAFVFSDDYSVFDWGRMPDEIPEKGRTLCLMGAANFEALETAGIPTHYRGVTADGRTGRTTELEKPPRRMEIELTRVPELPFRDGSYDYEAYHAAGGENYLVPLEIVFRNRVPIGSSLRSRTEPDDHDLGIAAWPDHDIELAAPIVECSTKFEESDRYLDAEEAEAIAGAASLEELRRLAHEVNELITDRAADAGLDHLDGKIEVLYHQGELKVADVVGTFDENRFAYEGTQVSKEVIRQYYARTDPEWVEAVTAAKREARQRDVADWRALCTRSPAELPQPMIELASDLYRSGANAYLGDRWFDAPPLRTVVRRVE